MASPVDFSARSLSRKEPIEQSPFIATWNGRKVKPQKVSSIVKSQDSHFSDKAS